MALNRFHEFEFVFLGLIDYFQLFLELRDLDELVLGLVVQLPIHFRETQHLLLSIRLWATGNVLSSRKSRFFLTRILFVGFLLCLTPILVMRLIAVGNVVVAEFIVLFGQ